MAGGGWVAVGWWLGGGGLESRLSEKLSESGRGKEEAGEGVATGWWEWEWGGGGIHLVVVIVSAGAGAKSQFLAVHAAGRVVEALNDSALRRELGMPSDCKHQSARTLQPRTLMKNTLHITRHTALGTPHKAVREAVW